ncbi:MAG: glycoside hydrolase family 18 protein [Prevotella sp.]|nr:glycoside hydrolase family 18 protein [Prevotella sp.]
MKKFLTKVLSATLMLMVCNIMMAKKTTKPQEKIVVAYVAGWSSDEVPDPTLMTHINFAFGHVNKTFNGVDIQREEIFRKVVNLKKQNPKLKVLLSIGGWTSGNFSEMAADAKLRMNFAKDCKRIVAQYGIDGIDIDWEYPTSSEAGISSSPDDTNNFTLLMRDIRKQIGKKKLLTCATIADGLYINFHDCNKYIDFVNIMAYDVANPPKHHTTLFRSPLSGRITVSEAVEAHIRNGVPANKLTLGMPLYGRGDHNNKILDKFVKTGYHGDMYQIQRDNIGKVPYLTDKTGKLVWGYDDPQALADKCQYIIDKGLLGGMYWECNEDNTQKDGMHTIYLSLMKNHKASTPKKRVLVIADNPQAENNKLYMDWLAYESRVKNFDLNITTVNELATKELKRYHLVINLLSDETTWNKASQEQLHNLVAEAEASYLSVQEAPLAKDSKNTWRKNIEDSLFAAPIKGNLVKVGLQYQPAVWAAQSHSRSAWLYTAPLGKQANSMAVSNIASNAISWALHE